LILNGGPRGDRATQWIPGSSGVQIRVDGPGMTPLTLTASLSNQVGAAVTVASVPTGNHRIVTLNWLDAAGRPFPGGVLKTTVDIPGSSAATASIGRSTTPRGYIFDQLLASDRAPGSATTLAASTDPVAVQALVDQLVQQVGTYPELVDTAGIAAAIAANQTVPAVDPRFVLSPALLDVTLEGVPGAAPADVWVDDPLSPKNSSLGNGTHRLSPVAPGTWVLHVRDASMSIEATQSVTLAASQSSAASVSLAVPVSSVAQLNQSLGASAAGIVNLFGSPVMLLAGGVTRATDSVGYTSGVTSFDGTNWSATTFPLPVPFAYGQGATLGGNFYVVGGQDRGALKSWVYCFNGTTWSTPSVLPAPRGEAAVVASTDSLYVVGGYQNPSWGNFGTTPPPGNSATDFNAATAYRFNGSSWSPLGSGMNTARGDMAAAIANGRLYVFGGYAFDGSGNQNPLGSVESMDLASGIWRSEPSMPTARGGSAAVVVNGLVYVIGGCTIGGIPLASIEVFDPVRAQWTVHAPLRRPRGFLAAALMNGQIVAAGGSDGGPSGQEGIPVSTVETVAP
jgi:hypothetical protein